MNTHEPPPSAAFLNRVGEFLALQARFSRQYNLLPSHWLALHSALASVRYQQGQWICSEFSTAEIARDSLTSRETVRRSMQWLLAKGLVIRTKRRYVLAPSVLMEIRDLLDHETAARDIVDTAAPFRDYSNGSASATLIPEEAR